MTKQEAFDYLKDSKVYVNGKSKEIQGKLFEVGFEWRNNGAIILYTEKPFLHIHDNHCITYCSDMKYFHEYPYKELTAEQILSIKIKEKLVPKDGDIVHYEGNGCFWTAIFKSCFKNGVHAYYVLQSDNHLVFDNWCEDLSIGLATKEQAQELFDALGKEGKCWNPATKSFDTVFRDGDILTVTQENRVWTYIYKKESIDECRHTCHYYYAQLNIDGSLSYNDFNNPYSGNVELASEEYRQRLFFALEKDNKRWNAGKKCVEDIVPNFQPFQKVLVKTAKDDCWCCDLFSHQNDLSSYNTVGGYDWNYCIPYEGNEHLVGTSNLPK